MLLFLGLILSLQMPFGQFVPGRPVVVDPVGAYIRNPPKLGDVPEFEPRPVETVFEIQVDFSGNGKKFILLSTPNHIDEAECNYWSVYMPVEGGYRKLVNGLLFPVTKCKVVPTVGASGESIASYHHWSYDEEHIYTSRFDSNGFVADSYKVIRKINPYDRKDSDFEAEFFADSKRYVTEINAKEYLAAHPASAATHPASNTSEPEAPAAAATSAPPAEPPESTIPSPSAVSEEPASSTSVIQPTPVAPQSPVVVPVESTSTTAKPDVPPSEPSRSSSHILVGLVGLGIVLTVAGVVLRIRRRESPRGPDVH